MIISLAQCRLGFPDHPYGVVLSVAMIDSLVEMVTLHLYGMHAFNSLDKMAAISADMETRCVHWLRIDIYLLSWLSSCGDAFSLTISY